VRILLVSNMYPSAGRPEFGIFVRNLERALVARGNEVVPVVLDDPAHGRVHTPAKYARLAARTAAAARRVKPDVVYAHYLVPTGLIAAATRRPFVVTAHGGDVANAERGGPLAAATRAVISRAAAVICVSEYLAERLPSTPRRLEVIDCGVDTTVWRPAPRAPGDGPRYLYVGSLTERKNVGRLLEAFGRLGEGSLRIVGAGPLDRGLRAAAPAGVEFLGRVPHEQLLAELAGCDVLCQPSLVEPQGQALLEALACARPVVATRVGGPPEFVTPECGALVDPVSVDGIAEGMRAAAALPVPCEAAVRVAAEHDVAAQAARVEAVLRSVS
jgi:glycosyltransferase involved in cell wall biosynthesis